MPNMNLRKIDPHTGQTAASSTLVEDADGNLGSHTNAPQARLHLADDGGIVAEGALNQGAAVAPSGSGVRFVWNPRKGALRAGEATADDWDDTNVGTYSLAFCRASRASAHATLALGENCRAEGIADTCIGTGVHSTGGVSTGIGYAIRLSAAGCFAFGTHLEAGAGNAMAIGSGVDSANPLLNSTSASLVVAFNTDQPTLFVGPGSGAGTQGRVGINTTSPTCALDIRGSLALPVEEPVLNGSYTIPDDAVFVCPAVGSMPLQTVMLPAVTKGRMLVVINRSGTGFYLTAQPGESIEGVQTVQFYPTDLLRLIGSGGTEWTKW